MLQKHTHLQIPVTQHIKVYFLLRVYHGSSDSLPSNDSGLQAVSILEVYHWNTWLAGSSGKGKRALRWSCTSSETLWQMHVTSALGLAKQPLPLQWTGSVSGTATWSNPEGRAWNLYSNTYSVFKNICSRISGPMLFIIRLKPGDGAIYAGSHKFSDRAACAS